jgi:hypothetical protein
VQLRHALDRYGEKALRVALQCITRHGNAGMVRGLLVLSLCAVLEAKPQWLNHPQIVATFAGFDFRKVFANAGHRAGGFSRAAFGTALGELITNFLTKSLGVAAA